MKRLNISKIAIWLVGAAILLAMPLILHKLPFLLYNLSRAGVLVIAAIGLNILTGYAGQMSLGHAGYIAIGAYASAVLALNLHWPFWIALPVAALFTGIFGFVLVVPALRLSGPYLAIATLGFGVAVPQLIVKWPAILKPFASLLVHVGVDVPSFIASWETLIGGWMGLHPPRPTIGPITLNTDAELYFFVLFWVVVVSVLALNVMKSRTGRALIALRDSETAAQAMGIHLPTYKSIAFVLSAICAGVAGSLYGYLVGFISPYDFGLAMSIDLLVMIVIGGLASIQGSILGAVFLSLLTPLFSMAKDVTWLPTVVRNVMKDLPTVIYGVALILVVIFMPLGLWGWVRKQRLKWAEWNSRRRLAVSEEERA